MEFVYVVTRRELFDLAFPHGFVRRGADPVHDVDRSLTRIRAHGFFLERRRAEQDSSFKQIIPYCVLCAGERLFALRRLATQGETRLHGLESIGLGGHINPVDSDDVLVAGMRRELDEEVRLDAPWTAEVAGLINDESLPVGSVHFGVVFLVRLTAPAAMVRETDQMEGAWTPVSDLRARAAAAPDRFESWSRLILERWDELAGVGAG